MRVRDTVRAILAGMRENPGAVIFTSHGVKASPVIRRISKMVKKKEKALFKNSWVSS